MTKYLVHYNGTVDSFKKLNTTDYNKSIVFISGEGDTTGACIYTHGKYYGNISEYINGLKYFSGISDGINVASATSPNSVITFNGVKDDPTIVTTVTAEGVTLDLTESIKQKISSMDTTISSAVDVGINKVSLNYISSDKKINLMYGDQVLNSIDASDFIKDGMVDSVNFEQNTGILTITFNTDSGKEQITTDLSSLISTYSAGNGISITQGSISTKIKDGDQYLEVTSDGIATKNISEQISQLQQLISELAERVTTNEQNIANIQEAIDWEELGEFMIWE